MWEDQPIGSSVGTPELCRDAPEDSTQSAHTRSTKSKCAYICSPNQSQYIRQCWRASHLRGVLSLQAHSHGQPPELLRLHRAHGPPVQHPRRSQQDTVVRVPTKFLPRLIKVAAIVPDLEPHEIAQHICSSMERHVVPASEIENFGSFGWFGEGIQQRLEPLGSEYLLLLYLVAHRCHHIHPSISEKPREDCPLPVTVGAHWQFQ